MGEYAEMILEGDSCQYCGEYLGDGDGYPRSCAGCSDEEDTKPKKAAQRGKTKAEWAQSITDKTMSAIKMHGNAGWSKAHHRHFAERLRAVIQEGMEFDPKKIKTVLEFQGESLELKTQ